MKVHLLVTMPVEIAQALEERCEAWGVDKNQLLSAVLLNHLAEETDSDNPGWRLLDALERWEAGDRTIPRWLRVNEHPLELFPNEPDAAGDEG